MWNLAGDHTSSTLSTNFKAKTFFIPFLSFEIVDTTLNDIF